MAPTALGEKVQGLGALLDAAKLLPYREAAEAWCDAVGAVEAAELVEAVDEFADALGLKLMERRRLQKVAASWNAVVFEKGCRAELESDSISEHAQDEPLPEPVVGGNDQRNMCNNPCNDTDRCGHYGKAAYHTVASEASSTQLDTATGASSFYGSLSMSSSGSFYGRAVKQQQHHPVHEASADSTSVPRMSTYYTTLWQSGSPDDCPDAMNDYCDATSSAMARESSADGSSLSHANWQLEVPCEDAALSDASTGRSQPSASYDGLAELLDHDLVLAALAEA